MNMSLKNKPSNTKSRTRHDFYYFMVATRYFMNFLKAQKEIVDKDVIDSVNKWKEELKKSDIKSMDEKQIQELSDKYKISDFTSNVFGIRTFGHITVVFSAMCLESLINDYCVLNKSATYFKKYIDKLDTTSKWLIVPQIITNKQISTDSQAFQLLGELFSMRNSMVHPKSKEYDVVNDGGAAWRDDYREFIKSVPLCFKTIKEATFELYKIDPGFEYLDDYKWLWDKGSKLKNISEVYSFYSSIWGINKNEK
jgi:hypothetical protein